MHRHLSGELSSTIGNDKIFPLLGDPQPTHQDSHDHAIADFSDLRPVTSDKFDDVYVLCSCGIVELA
jgi:hypothetical protein